MGIPEKIHMLTRDPELFLKALSEAFHAHATRNSISERNAHFFYGAKSAAMSRLMALDRIIPEFESFLLAAVSSSLT